ncbi:MAG: hypothetical protein MHMPM18_004199 [Marteilia pararefringens]
MKCTTNSCHRMISPLIPQCKPLLSLGSKLQIEQCDLRRPESLAAAASSELRNDYYRNSSAVCNHRNASAELRPAPPSGGIFSSLIPKCDFSST